jgi:hypothetical protein
MLLQLFKCQRCNHRFEAEVVDKDEPRERDLPTHPLRCPSCHSTMVEILRTIERRVRRAS